MPSAHLKRGRNDGSPGPESWPLWGIGIAAAGLFAGITAWLWPLEPGVLALQFAATPRAFGQVVHVWGAEGLERFRAHLPFDWALLAAYGAFGWRLAHQWPPLAHWRWRRVTAVLLPLAALADAGENLLHAWLTEVPRFGVPLLYQLAATASGLKWLLLLAFVVVALVAWLRQP